MRRLVAVVLAGALLLGPGVSLVGVAVLMNPAAHASCVLAAPGAGVSVGDVPDHLDVTTRDGVAIRLEHSQLVHAATIIDTGARTSGVGRDGIVVALMAALTESGLRMLSNTGAYPDSANYPNDGDGGDHDSLGLFQMRPSTGWGSVAELMDSGYQARAFYGGPTGPNHGSPRGLLDIPGWRQLPKGAAAQAVEVSAYPDRYARFEPVAEAILEALTRTEPAPAKSVREVPESGRIVFPLPAGTWTRTSGFGMRVHPITGERTLHTGVDLAAAVGTPILASADGKVTFAGSASGYGNLILIEHNVRGAIVVSGYAHMYADGIQVHPGDRVTAGQHIADVGSAGNSTGPHLHFEIRAGASGTPVDPEPWLAGHGAASVDSAAPTSGGCGSATNVPGRRPGALPRWRPEPARRRPHHRREDHRPDFLHPRPSPSRLPRLVVVVLVAAAGDRFRAPARPCLRRHVRQQHRHPRHRPSAGAGVGGRQLAQGPRPATRRRVPDLAGPHLVGRPRRRRLAQVRRWRHARPRLCYWRSFRSRPLD